MSELDLFLESHWFGQDVLPTIYAEQQPGFGLDYRAQLHPRKVGLGYRWAIQMQYRAIQMTMFFRSKKHLKTPICHLLSTSPFLDSVFCWAVRVQVHEIKTGSGSGPGCPRTPAHRTKSHERLSLSFTGPNKYFAATSQYDNREEKHAMHAFFRWG